MKKDINLCIDLGGDTMKIACAYRDADGEKISRVIEPGYSDSAIPAIAYYADETDSWRYGYSIGRVGETSYSTVVKIKDLVSLVYKNRNFYEKEHLFPVFEFPITNEIDEEYYIRYGKGTYPQDKKKYYDSLHFTAPSSTPKSVSEDFFRYVAKIAEKFLRDLSPEMASSGDVFNSSGLKYTILYPPKIAKQAGVEGEYDVDDLKTELKRLVKLGFGIRGDKNIRLLSSAKALAMTAANSGKIGNGQCALLFDIGEEFISVTKVRSDTIKGELSVSIDGLTGHSDPEKIGGNDIDKAIGEAFERSIIDKENIGTNSFGEGERINERGLKSKNYLFLKSIKSAKTIFSARNHGEDFPAGVPVSIIRDVEVFRNITADKLLSDIGIERGVIERQRPGANSKIAARIADYILGEVTDHADADRDVKKLYLCGGVSGTVGLISAVKAELKKKGKSYEVESFMECLVGLHSSKDSYAFRERDMYSYSPAVGGAMIGLLGIDIKVLLTKTYGTVFEWRTSAVPQYRKSHFSVLVDRGTDLSFEGNPAITPDGNFLEFKFDKLTVNSAETKAMIMYETSLTSEDIKNKHLDHERSGKFEVKYFDSPDDSGPYLFMPYGDPSGRSGTFNDEENEAAAIRKMLGIDFVVCGREKSRVGGDDKSKICLFVKDRGHPVTNVLTPSTSLYCVYGVKIDKEGNVIPFVDNDIDRNLDKKIGVEYMDGGVRRTATVSAEDIMVDFKASDFKFATPI
ncbi:MAG: hypothetical protein LUD29_06455 [Clostridia bacterium]|nr:hypothetical protein [Clostridia bacterium]